MFFSTLRALSTPRRAIPLCLIAVTMLAAEWLATRSVVALAIDSLLFIVFCLFSPASFRWLCSAKRPLAGSALAYSTYVFIGSGLVALFGLVLPMALHLDWTYVIEPPSLGILLVLFLVGGWGLGRDIDLEEGFESAHRRATHLAIEAEHAHLLALRAQLDPHFLFNTLNAIAEWCREDPAVAEKATLGLARILRTILDGIQKSTWSLGEEIALLRGVFELYRTRDEERYRLVMQVPNPLPQAQVPPMLLLPLLENAITHGPGAGHAGPVSLDLQETLGGIRVTLCNPGGFKGRRKGGEGIGIVERRLALTFGDEAALSIKEESGATVAVVSFPIQPNQLG